MALLVAVAPWWLLVALVVPGPLVVLVGGGFCWLFATLEGSWWLLVTPGNDGRAKKALISKLEGNKAGESIPLMFGVLPRDNFPNSCSQL